MNNKDIIRTLRNADKTSVEKLMAEESKKNEIFAKAQHKANIDTSEYTDSVSGVEKYERRISMTRIASIAAAAVLLIGSISGGAYMMRKNNNDPVTPGQVEPATTTEPTTTAGLTTGTASTVSTTADTTTSNTSTETTTAENTAQQISVTKEDLIEKAMDDNSVKYFDQFSADYSILINERREFHTEPETHTGKIYLDEVGMTAAGTEERFVNDKLISRSLFAVKDGQAINGDEYCAETDYVNGGYKSLETPLRNYYTQPFTDKVIINRMPTGRNIAINVNAPENWEITGERTESGRKIVSISGFEKGNNNYEGVYREYTYTAEIDAATGITISYDVFDSEGNTSYSYKMTNYKFDDDAVEFKSASDIISEIENGGFTKLGD
ncbi:hypothetical protein [Ruminococcus flavefaciens]|uniref:Uncharacterized protein n=1 Tax=Ruminococcus flavefaciens 007c TaxID=1341157 RepID=W7UGV8_RUMFL|nr:hypothetical protein [Ruminococcus flavefaciens]EWM53153.1 hypothetical protein RF007C_16200 [Ruminococcus flavefaciens 007c]